MPVEEILIEEGNVTRFLFNRNDFGNGRVKHSGFIPPPSSLNELSVCQIDELENHEIWEIGANSTRPNQTAKARGDICVIEISKISDAGGSFLGVYLNKIPHKHHCNIKVIPSEKAKMRAIATELAQISKLIFPISS